MTEQTDNQEDNVHKDLLNQEIHIGDIVAFVYRAEEQQGKGSVRLARVKKLTAKMVAMDVSAKYPWNKPPQVYPNEVIVVNDQLLDTLAMEKLAGNDALRDI